MRLKPGALLRFYSLCGILVQGTASSPPLPHARGGRDAGGALPRPGASHISPPPPAPLLTLSLPRPSPGFTPFPCAPSLPLG